MQNNQHELTGLTRTVFLKFLCVLVLMLLAIPQVQAQRWISFDTGARGMGQAGVANIHSPAAIYWNPANIQAAAEPSPYITHIDGIADLVVEGDVLFTADQLSDLLDEIDIDAIQARLNQATFTTEDVSDIFRLTDTLASLTQPGAGVVADVGGGVAVQHGKWVVSYRYLSRIGLSAELDAGEDANLSLADEGLVDLNDGLDALVQQRITNGDPLNQPATVQGQALSQQLQALAADNGIALSAEAADEFFYQGEQVLGAQLSDPVFVDFINQVLSISAGTLANGNNILIAQNESGVVIKGLTLQDIAVGRSFVIPGMAGEIRFGLSGRLIRGNTFRRGINYRDFENGKALINDVFDAIGSENKTTYRGTLDGGLSYTPHSSLTLGLAARNLIPTSYGFVDGSKFKLDTQLRAGVALRPLPWLSLSLDGDLIENETSALPGFTSRIVGGGVEVASTLGKFEYALRGGAYVNLAQPDINKVYTLGLELKRGPVSISTEAHVTAHDVNIESASEDTRLKNFPKRLGGSISMGLVLPF